MRELIQRINAHTPKYWQMVRNVAGTLTVVCTVIITAHVPLPESLINACGYMLVASAIVTGLAQTAKSDE